MDTSSQPDHDNNAIQPRMLILLAVLCGSLLALFWTGLAQMLKEWERPEYNHGYLIPVVALYLFWLKAAALKSCTKTGRCRGSWLGIGVTGLGLFVLLLGELSAVYSIVQYGFLVCLWGVAITAVGWRGLRLIWVPLVYLFFMVPLPNFLYQSLSGDLQLVSSQLGVAVIRAFGISVFLEGNVIDLGTYQLQVAEACNGLRYLFPLMSFGFLLAAIFDGKWWQRAIVFVSTIPITILMNSFRIGVIGVLVNGYGIEQAEGFLHYFEGWVVFMVCVGFLFLEMALFARMNSKRFMESFGLDIPPAKDLTTLFSGAGVNKRIVTMAVILGVSGVFSAGIGRPVEIVPERPAFSLFPLLVGDWRGQEQPVEQVFLNVLKTDDELMAVYQRGGPNDSVGLWIAYYDSQRKGKSVHSPRACIPGGGWKIESFDQYAIENVQANGDPLMVNRSVVSMGEARQLVYYWFEQRGRKQTNEYMVKWFIFWDSLTKNRTDGALVRVTTFVPDAAQLSEAAARLEDFVRTINPQLNYFLPQESAVLQSSLPE